MEPLYDLLSYLLFSKRKYELNHANKHEAFNKLRHPLVYHPRYNITACGLEKIHPFDSCKYGRVISFLKNYGVIDSESHLYKPNIISRAILTTVFLKN